MTKIVNMSKVVPQLIQEKHSCLYHKTPKLQQVGIRGEKNYTFNKCNLHLEINMDKILKPSVTRFVIPELCTFFHNLAYIIIWGKQVNSLKKIMGVSLFLSLSFSVSLSLRTEYAPYLTYSSTRCYISIHDHISLYFIIPHWLPSQQGIDFFFFFLRFCLQYMIVCLALLPDVFKNLNSALPC